MPTDFRFVSQIVLEREALAQQTQTNPSQEEEGNKAQKKWRW